jgi:membrane-associated phospholipid phosphatase
MSAEADTSLLRWRTYGLWAGINLLAFGVLYPLVNWLTSLRADTFEFYMDIERSIPFLPVWIWVYLSINPLFMLPPLFLRACDMPILGRRMLVATVCGCIIFLLLPARLGFERVVPDDWQYRFVFGALFRADGPHNLMPSLHVTYAMLCIFSFLTGVRGWLAGIAWIMWLVSIMASTVLVHQHHLMDVASGLLLALVITFFMPSAIAGN